MSFIADLHIHSYLSRATSPACRLEELAAWANIKGIDLIGTGDFTHPKWISEIKRNLTPSEPGFFKLKKPHKLKINDEIDSHTGNARFVLSCEISSIYKKNGKTRKIHNIVFAPDIPVAEKISSRLSRIGNIKSDGRPILGLDAKDLLAIVLEASPDAHVVPAHIWTPWFSLFGSKSGFDHLEECFEDLSSHIFALETGLSSDPSMNWLISHLDKYSLISNSDAHSPGKLGREANLFDCPFDYYSMFNSLKTKKGFLGTVEFYPEEGKYHLDGHRKCNLVLKPKETKKHKGICPVCQKPLTIGVLNRVVELSDREKPKKPEQAGDFRSLIPLSEVIAETVGTRPQSKKVALEYFRLIKTYGSEFDVLLHAPEDSFESDINPHLGLAIRRMRQGHVVKQPGYDGEFGVIKVFSEKERSKMLKKKCFFLPLID